MGYSKANFYIQQAMTYTVDLQNPEAPEAVLTIRHTHQLDEPQPCPHWSEYTSPEEPDLSRYRWATDRCYWDYLRALIPAGSRLTNIETQPVPVEWSSSDLDNGNVSLREGEAGTYMLGTFLIVPPGGVRETVFYYHLPPDVLEQTEEGWRYRLNIQKQAGREGIPVVVQIQIPAAAAVVDAVPALYRQDKQQVTWSVELATDQALDLVVASEDAIFDQQPRGMTP
jgi:hypothetical protein